MPKLSGLTKRERALAERAGGKKIGRAALSDAQVLGVGFVLTRRTRHVSLLDYTLEGHTADEVRESIEDLPGRSSGDGDE